MLLWLIGSAPQLQPNSYGAPDWANRRGHAVICVAFNLNRRRSNPPSTLWTKEGRQRCVLPSFDTVPLFHPPQTLNKNNLLPDERSNFYQAPLQQTNVYTTTYYPTALGKYDYQPNSSPSPCRTYNHTNNS